MQNTNGIIKNAMNNSVTPSSFAIRTVSVVIPVMNEQGNILPLFNRLVEALNQASLYHEIIFIDDGSTDQTFKELCLLHQQYPQWVRVVQFRKNFGKTPALVAGFARCRGSVIITMDGDLQDDPQEIPRFLATLDEGYDVVSGWKFPRLDPLSKTF